MSTSSNSSKAQLFTKKVRVTAPREERSLFLIMAGNWSLFTSTFSDQPLYTYFDPFKPASILQTEVELFGILAEEGPFDGVIGYSEGAEAAAQLLIRDAKNHPWKLPHERVFPWAVFINGGSPIEVFHLTEAEATDGVIESSEEVQKALSVFVRHSNTRARKGDQNDPDFDPERLKKLLSLLQIKQLVDGRLFLTDGEYGMTRYDGGVQGSLIDVPTLHVRCPSEENRHHGLHLLEMCEKSCVVEYHHTHGHDFPRGRAQMKQIANLIRDTAERAGRL